jgi:NAD(P)-dependent dehydrogenase (short-subunit alcohol dehydrogenase family)
MMLDEKVVVITGGAGLLGREFSRAAAANGATVVLTDIDEAAAEEAAARIRKNGGRVESALLNIGNIESIEAVIADLHRRHGRIDAVVNNAYPRNRNYGRHLEDVEYADFCENVQLHLGGYFLVAQRFAHYFKGQGGGSIVNLASVYGLMAPRFEIYEGTSMTMPVEYAAIKAGVIQLTRYFAQYYKRSGIRCNALAPGGVRDAQPESFMARYYAHGGTKGMLAPEDVSGALIFLLSEAARYVTGQVLVVDDGFSL